MPKDFDCIVYMKHVQLEITVPKEHVWDFILEFGQAFAVQDLHNGPQTKTIDKYWDHPNGWHITITIWHREEARFYEWFDAFCKARELTFRGLEDDEML